MAIDFPNSPTNGQTFTVGTKTWTYSSAENQWLLSSVSPDSGTLTTKGDLLTRSNSALVRLPVGSNGDLLVADSGATEGLRWQGQANTGRNLVINGAMQVAQRGTSTTGITTSGYYTADRWVFDVGTLGTWTQTIENDAPTGSGLRKSLKVLCTTADASPTGNDQARVRTVFEGQDLQRIKKGTSAAEQLTLSFWVKSNVTGTYVALLLDVDNDRQVSAQYTVSASATWEKKTITFPADTTGALDNDNARSFDIFFWLGAGPDRTSGTLRTSWTTSVAADGAVGQTNVAAATNNYWQVTGVQLEVGPVATGFDFEPYETTLRKCQRYYYRLTNDAVYRAFSRTAVGYSSTAAQVWFNAPVPMRVKPTVVEYSSTIGLTPYPGTTIIAVNSMTLAGDRSEYMPSVDTASTSGITTGTSYTFIANNSANQYIAFGAEL